jgi:hypothetical protein
MHSIKAAVFLLSCLLLPGLLIAQDRNKRGREMAPPDTIFSVRWDTTKWDFGHVRLNVHPTKEFGFKNIGNVPVTVHFVGGGDPVVHEWTKEPVMPGKKGFIKVTYGAFHTGSFQKAVYVKFDVFEEPFILSIQGVVEDGASPAPEPAKVKKGPSVDWDPNTWNLGEIPQHVPASRKFIVTNTGDSPLIIEGVFPSCGCTKFEISGGPILPGMKGFVTLIFDANMPGVFDKSATVKTNASEVKDVLIIKGKVVVAPAPK